MASAYGTTAVVLTFLYMVFKCEFIRHSIFNYEYVHEVHSLVRRVLSWAACNTDIAVLNLIGAWLL